MDMDADGKLTAPSAEKPQERPSWRLLDTTLPGQDWKGRMEGEPSLERQVKGSLETTCRGNKLALAAILLGPALAEQMV